MSTLLAELEDTNGDVPVIPHAHSGAPAPTVREWTLTDRERRYGRAWVAEIRRTLRERRSVSHQREAKAQLG